MSLVALDGTPLVAAGAPWRPNGALAASSTTMAVTKAACIMYGYVFTEDGGSHTIDTGGSSSLGWRTGAITFANAGTTVKVGLAAVDTGNGPPGRATNSTGTVTLDVSKSLTGGGGGITATAWQEHVPDAGTKAVANGDLIAFVVQMTVRAGADSVIVQTLSQLEGVNSVLPSVSSFDGTSTYTAVTSLPNAVITFSDGVRGYFFGSHVWATMSTSQTWNSASATKEYGNYFLAPFPMKVYGFYATPNIGGDTDFVLYSDPLGTPVAQKTVSVDANVIGQAANSRWINILFPAPYTVNASTPIAAIVKPGATNITVPYVSFNISGHQKCLPFGANGYAVNRASGAFATQNSNKDRFGIGLLIGAFDDAVATSLPSRSRIQSGF